MVQGRFETSHRQALYDLCSTEQVSAFRGTPYSCNENDLVESSSLPTRVPHPVQSFEIATAALKRFHDPIAPMTTTVQAAIDRLRAALQINDWKSDIIIKAFHDLDIVFFDGKLRGMTTISWHCASWWNNLERSPDGHRHFLALTEYLGNQKAAIHLNAWSILLDTPDAKVTMWSVVLHEMVHAYELVMCGNNPPTWYDQYRGWDDSHGLMFRHLINSVHGCALRYLNMPAIYMNFTRDCREEIYEI